MTNTVDTKPFEWTDELVKEFLNDGERYKYNWEKEINDFKQTKSIPNKQDEKIRISDFRGDRIYKDPRITDTIYLFNSSKDIPKDKFPAIKQAIEAAINQPSTTPIEDKGWEILTWFSREGEVALLVCGEIEGNLYAGYKIRSVRRTSDNEVFTVGDNIEFGSAGLKPDTPIELDNAAIISWNIREDGMIYAEILKDIFFPINHLRKSKPQDKGNVLFTKEQYLEIWGMIFQATGFKPPTIQYTFDNPKGKIKLP